MLKGCKTDYLRYLSDKIYFSRNDLLEAMEKCGIKIGAASFKANLQRLLNDGEIIRVGRNAYCVSTSDIMSYGYTYSERASAVAQMIKENYPYLKFTIMELIQYNEFVNHQLAHNVIFLSAEDNLGDFVFDKLKVKYPGEVLINPSVEMYHQYWYDNMIVIDKMISEAPLDSKTKWMARLEKILVDLLTDPLLQSSITTSEYPSIYEEAFSRYAIDESCLFRYARRRGSEKKIKDFITDKTNIRLRLEQK